MSDEAKEILSRSLVHQISQLQTERDALRAELAAANAQLEETREQIDDERYERDALRALLREARAFCPGDYYAHDRLRARIDAALGGQGDA